MLRKLWFFAFLAVVAGGCVQPKHRPPAIIDELSYTVKKTPGADERISKLTSLSLADAQRIALANNPSYLKAYYAVNAARMRYYQALGQYSPQIGISFSIGDQASWNKKNVYVTGSGSSADRSNTFYTNTNLQASWLLFDGLARYFSVKAAESEHNYYKEMDADDCRLLMRSVAYAYNAIMLAIENQNIALEDMNFQTKNLKITQAKYQAGALPRSDVLNFEIYVNSAETNFISAQYQYEVAVYALAVLMGYPEGTLPDTIKYPPIPTKFAETLPSVETYLDAAIANRPDLRALRERLKIAQYQLYQTYSAYSPTLSAYANFNYATTYNQNSGVIYNPDTPFAGDGGTLWSYNAGPAIDYGLQAQWTLFNGFIRYNRYREAAANLSAAHYDLAGRWITVVNEVRGAYANYIQSVKKAKILEKTLKLTTEQRDLVQEEYDAGNTEITRLNEAQRDLVDAQSSLAGAYITVQNASAQLDAAVAELTADYYRDSASRNSSVPGLLSDAAKTGTEQAPAEQGGKSAKSASDVKAEADAAARTRDQARKEVEDAEKSKSSADSALAESAEAREKQDLSRFRQK